jgi:hypothetical protein
MPRHECWFARAKRKARAPPKILDRPGAPASSSHLANRGVKPISN